MDGSIEDYRIEYVVAGFRGCCPTFPHTELHYLARRGGRDINKNAAKPPLKERTGWFVQQPIIRGLNQPPRLRPPRRLRDILLLGAATPPCQGGEFARL